jgi:hypothetical protein
MFIPDVLCLKIELLDFSPDIYTLNVSYENVKTSINNTFDFTKEVTEAMYRLNLRHKVYFERQENGKEYLDNMPKDINFLHIGGGDLVSLCYNKTIKLNDIQHVKIYGYFLENTTWKYGERIVKLHSNNLSAINANFSTPFMDFYFGFDYGGSIPRPDEIIFTMYVDSQKYIELTYSDIKKKMEYNALRQFLRIPFRNFDEKYYSCTSLGQPEEVIKNTLCLGRVDHLFVITNHITLKKIDQWRYMRCLYPEMLCVYSD